MWPQIIWIMTSFTGLGVNLSNYVRDDNIKGIFADIISLIISYGLLYWGGFFDCFFK